MKTDLLDLQLDARILIVDDEEKIRTSLEGIFIRFSKEVQTASDGQEALELIEGGWLPDLILLDISMPNMNGYELLDRLEQDGIAIPTIMLTARNEAPYIQEAVRRKQIIDYLTKPFEVKSLIETAVRAMQKIQDSMDESTAVSVRSIRNSLNALLYFSNKLGGEQENQTIDTETAMHTIYDESLKILMEVEKIEKKK
jgi:CheY-like chemotaxis protein